MAACFPCCVTLAVSGSQPRTFFFIWNLNLLSSLICRIVVGKLRLAPAGRANMLARHRRPKR